MIWIEHDIEDTQVYICCINFLSIRKMLRTMLSVKSPTYDMVNCGLYFYDQVSYVCQFPSIESWGYLYPKTIAACLDPCHVSRYPNSSYDSIGFSQSCDSRKPHDLSQLSDISNILLVNGI